MLRTCFVSLTLAVLATPASASLIGVNSLDLYSRLSGDFGMSDYLIDLTPFKQGLNLPTISGSEANVAWTASSAQGVYVNEVVPSGTYFLSTLQAGDTLTITFGGNGVMAFGANTFLTNAGDSVISGNVRMTLSDGTTFISQITSETTFYGWISEGKTAITSISYRPVFSGPDAFASLSNLRFALIPSSGAMAILALGGLVAARSRG